jgi:energy-coupling factor transporter ATP-binding protein EcfA2
MVLSNSNDKKISQSDETSGKPVISTIFDQPNANFVLLPAGEKFPPLEKGWQKKGHSFEEAKAHAEKGGNIGVMAGGKYIGLDEDDPSAFAELQLPTTTKWKTRPGRFGLWLKCSDRTMGVLSKYNKKADQSQIKLFRKGQPVGEIKFERTYQVIPSSWKIIDGSRVEYKMVTEVQPAEVSLKWLLSELARIGITFSKKDRDRPSREGGKRKGLAKGAGIEKNRERRYAQAALDNEVSILAKTPEGERNTQLNKSAFALGQFIAAGLLEESEVVRELLKAAKDKGLSTEESEKTIRSGLEAGALHPREIPLSGDWREIVTKAIIYMAHSCDGAHIKDGIGFNKFDADFGKSLAEKIKKGKNVTDEDLKSAYKRLKKYSEQLSSAGIFLPQTISESSSSESMSTLIVNLALEGGSELWHSKEGKTYITFEQSGHKEHHPLRSSDTESWLGRKVYELKQKAPPTKAIQDALNVLEGMAKYEGPEYPVYVRLAPHESKVYVDLGSSTWETIEIGSDGWRIVKYPPVRFRRLATQLPLPLPKSGGSWEDLRQLLGIHDKKQFIMIVGWLMQAYWPFGPYAHLILNGEQGSGKSGLTKALKGLVDPSKTVLRRPPKDEKDLMIAAQGERIIAFDNLSGLRVELSDCFCVMSNGGSLAGRRLFTDDEEAFLVASNPIILNGIDAVATRGDLIDRSIILYLQRIQESERLRDKDLVKRLDELQPSILGLILDATVMGLRREKEVEISNLPRMADFASWIAACEPALPWEEGEFMEVYKQATDEAMVDAVESDPFANAVIKLVRNIGKYEGSATRLWELLIGRECINGCHPPLGWPKNANGIKNKLKRIAPHLRKIGVGVEFDRSGHSRLIQIWDVAMGGDRLSDSDDSSVTAHNPQHVTKMTGMTAQNQLSLQSSNMVDECSGVQLKWDVGENKTQNSLSQPSLPSQDSETNVSSGCHYNVTEPSSFFTTADGMPAIGLHPRKDQPTPNSRRRKGAAPMEGDTCPICGVDISPGQSSRTFEGAIYCTSCAPLLSLLRASVGELTEKNGIAPSETEIYEHMASKNSRPPKKEFIPSMLRVLGLEERDGKWFLSSAKDVEAPAERADA